MCVCVRACMRACVRVSVSLSDFEDSIILMFQAIEYSALKIDAVSEEKKNKSN